MVGRTIIAKMIMAANRLSPVLCPWKGGNVRIAGTITNIPKKP